MTTTAPSTEAGKALLEDMQKYHDKWGSLEPDIWRDFVSARIPQIEAEAASAANARAERYAEALYRLHRFTEAVMSSSPTGKELFSFNDLRHAGTVLGLTTPNEYGDESDPWPDDTHKALVAVVDASEKAGS